MIRSFFKLLFPDLFDHFRRRKFRGDGFSIGRNVDLVSSKLLNGSRIAERASVRGSIIGKYSSIGRYTKVNNSDIGNFCSISWDCTIGATSHPYTRMTTSAFPYVKRMGFVPKDIDQGNKSVIIKNDVWIGANSVILPGVVINNGAVIGAGSVVTKDVPCYSIVAGSPARIIGYRFDQEIIDLLQSISWWDFPEEELKHYVHYFQEDLTIDKLNSLIKEIEKGI